MSNRAEVWTHFGRIDKVVPDSSKKCRLKDGSQTTKKISDPSFRKCNHCGQKVNRKLQYAVDHINICLSYVGNKYDDGGAQITNENKNNEKKQQNTNSKNKTKTKTNTNGSDGNHSTDEDSDSDTDFSIQSGQRIHGLEID